MISLEPEYNFKTKINAFQFANDGLLWTGNLNFIIMRKPIENQIILEGGTS